MDDHDQVLDLVRKMDGAPALDFVGEFYPDPEEVEAWKTPLSQEDNGEFRYANKSPSELRRMIEIETDPVEKLQMERIMGQFISRGLAIDPNDSRPTRAGEPYRGEPKVEMRPESLGAMAKDRKPVGHIEGGGGGRELSGAVRSGEGLGMVQGPGGIWEEQ